MKCPQYRYTDFQSALDQPLEHVCRQLETRNQKYFTTKFLFFFLYKFANIKVVIVEYKYQCTRDQLYYSFHSFFLQTKNDC